MVQPGIQRSKGPDVATVSKLQASWLRRVLKYEGPAFGETMNRMFRALDAYHSLRPGHGRVPRAGPGDDSEDIKDDEDDDDHDVKDDEDDNDHDVKV